MEQGIRDTVLQRFRRMANGCFVALIMARTIIMLAGIRNCLIPTACLQKNSLVCFHLVEALIGFLMTGLFIQLLRVSIF